jgi:NADH-quinone oxidoreductase subunit F
MSRSDHVEIRIGLSSCGIASGGLPVRAALERMAHEADAEGVVKVVGCNGMCHREPLVEVVGSDGGRTIYGDVSAEQARGIVARHVRPKRWLTRARWALRDLAEPFSRDEVRPSPLAPIDPTAGSAGAYVGKQKRIVLENCGEIDPLSLDDYLARGGYQALEKCLKTLPPDAVIDAIKNSGLRGRGGAGFPTGQKWSLARSQASAMRYVICNGDEGDPGAFMDRLVLEADPHRVLEGLAIAAYAIGASQGYLYVRDEYPLAVRHVREAIRQAEGRGLLGERILGTELSLRLELREGAGAFVCGEETALIASIEGRRGVPRLRPPYPVERGLRGQPTLINNVETLACVPWIVRHGAEAFAALGTETSKGTKVFALAGKINRGGLIEVPMGITIREIVEEIGGGIKEDSPAGSRCHTFKAVQVGGPSGGCIPARLADTRIDYEELTQTGAIMGSGGLIVLDERDCMVDIARYFLQFTQAESCGKCTFCRIGTKRMLEILERLCAGEGQPGDLENLEELADHVARTSLCGLGRTAPNPVLTTLKYFRDEYEAHLNEKRCPARRCPALIHYRVTDACIGCTLCAQACPVEAIEFRPYEKHEVDDEKCTRCGMCLLVCQDDAIEVV